MDLRDFDVIVISSSSGKDSQVMLDQVTGLADAQGALNRVIVLHADLGRLGLLQILSVLHGAHVFGEPPGLCTGRAVDGVLDDRHDFLLFQTSLESIPDPVGVRTALAGCRRGGHRLPCLTQIF